MEDKQSKLSKKDLNKAIWRWQFFSHANYNYERLQASSFALSMIPIIKKLYPDNKEKQIEAIQRHLGFFNTEPNFGAVIHGITVAMEEEKSDGAPISEEAINSIKVGLMGPLAGLGDTLTQGTIIPLLLAIGISFGEKGNLFGPLFFMLACSTALIMITRTTFFLGYKSGKNAVNTLLTDERFDKVINGASILGVMVIGALIAQYVQFNLALVLNIGSTVIDLQKDILDKIIPNLLAFGLTLLLYKRLQKGQNAIVLMVLIIVLSIIGAYVGLV